MKSLLGWIRGWRLALLICLLVAAGGGLAYQIWFGGLLRGGDATGLAADERLIPVRRDNLMSEITVNGSIAFTNKKDLTFGSPGFVDEILVTQGEIVSAGQPLARINPESVANLQQAVAQAQLEHTEALNALADARAPTLAVAEAEAAITDAALELKQARDALDTLVNPPTDTLSQAETAITDAALELKQARDALDTLVNPPANSIADAEEAVAQARLTLQDRQNSVGSAYADAAAALIESGTRTHRGGRTPQHGARHKPLQRAARHFRSERERLSQCGEEVDGRNAYRRRTRSAARRTLCGAGLSPR